MLATAGEIHRGLGPSPDTIDIHRAQGLSAFNLLRDLHEGLLTRDAAGRPVAGIARQWAVSDDGLTWTFELDPQARWSDGSALTADDFRRGFIRALDPEAASPTSGWLAPIETVEALSRHRLKIRLKHRVPWFEELPTLPVTYPWPAGGSALFSGPFRLAERVPGAHFRLEKNTHYREAGSVAADVIVWHVTEDPSAELARFRTGELHITESVPPGRHDWLKRELGDSLRVAPYLGSFYLVNEEWKVFVTNRRHGRITEVVRGGWIADWADPGNFLGNFHSESPLNYAFLEDSRFDRLLDRAGTAAGEARTELLWQAEQRMLDRNAIIPLYYY